jgi:uncharacterized protein (TIGR02186 family)
MLHWLCLLILLLPLPAMAKPLVADLSQYNIAIDSRFTGARLILFGARQAAGDVVVVVRGPARDYTIRQKERVGGIWVNRHHMDMNDIPDYYAIATTRPLDTLLTPHMQRVLQIGIPNLPYQQTATDDLSPPERKVFQDAFIDNRLRKRLYSDNIQPVSFMGDTLFKTILPFPDVTPRGGYTAETYLIYNGQIVGMQSTPIRVAKQGFDATLFQLAHEHPALYGILAVLMAVSAGWIASTLFRKV